MAHCRTYLLRQRGTKYTWTANAYIYRKRGTWAFRTNTFIWCKQWGFKTARAALMAASRFMKDYANGKLIKAK